MESNPKLKVDPRPILLLIVSREPCASKVVFDNRQADPVIRYREHNLARFGHSHRDLNALALMEVVDQRGQTTAYAGLSQVYDLNR